jgi:hypothetical protein
MFSAHMDHLAEKEAIAEGLSAVLSKTGDVETLVRKAHVLRDTG